MKPLIGLSSFVDPQPRADYIALSAHYPRSVREAGGIPLNIPVCTDLNIAVETVARIDGLLLSGGKDLAPWRYGEEPIREIGAFDSIRDEWELALFRAAGERGIPVLGICRGHQLINVAMGGTLYQDLWAQRKDCLGHAPQDFPVEELYHSVEITDHDSLLASVLGTDPIRVNSFHHQAVKLLAPGLKQTAVAPDGVNEAFEAFESSGPSRFIMGIQFHPESLTRRYPHFLGIFRAFVHAAEEFAAHR